jgi:hypothetical protein
MTACATVSFPKMSRSPGGRKGWLSDQIGDYVGGRRDWHIGSDSDRRQEITEFLTQCIRDCDAGLAVIHQPSSTAMADATSTGQIV